MLLRSDSVNAIQPSSGPIKTAALLHEAPLTKQPTPVKFPAPLSKVDGIKRAAKFSSSALPIEASYYSKSSKVAFTEAMTGNVLTQEEKEKI